MAWLDNDLMVRSSKTSNGAIHDVSSGGEKSVGTEFEVIGFSELHCRWQEVRVYCIRESGQSGHGNGGVGNSN